MQAHCRLWAICNLLGNTVQVDQTFKHTVDMLSHTPLRQTLHAYNRISVDTQSWHPQFWRHLSHFVWIYEAWLPFPSAFLQISNAVGHLRKYYMDSIRVYFPFTSTCYWLSLSYWVYYYSGKWLGTMASDWSQFFLWLTRNKSINKMQFL